MNSRDGQHCFRARRGKGHDSQAAGFEWTWVEGLESAQAAGTVQPDVSEPRRTPRTETSKQTVQKTV